MGFFVKHALSETEDGVVLTLYINPILTEFAKELGQGRQPKKKSDASGKRRRIYKRKIARCKSKRRKNYDRHDAACDAYYDRTGSGNRESGGYRHAGGAAVRTGNTGVAQRSEIVIFSDARAPKTAIPMCRSANLPRRWAARVWYNSDTRTVGINKGNTQIAFVIGAATARVNGRSVTMPPSYLSGSTAMAPVRFVSESLGMNVGWNNAANTVVISSKTRSVYRCGGGYFVENRRCAWDHGRAASSSERHDRYGDLHRTEAGDPRGVFGRDRVGRHDYL